MPTWAVDRLGAVCRNPIMDKAFNHGVIVGVKVLNSQALREGASTMVVGITVAGVINWDDSSKPHLCGLLAGALNIDSVKIGIHDGETQVPRDAIVHVTVNTIDEEVPESGNPLSFADPTAIAMVMAIAAAAAAAKPATPPPSPAAPLVVPPATPQGWGEYMRETAVNAVGAGIAVVGGYSNSTVGMVYGTFLTFTNADQREMVSTIIDCLLVVAVVVGQCMKNAAQCVCDAPAVIQQIYVISAFAVVVGSIATAFWYPLYFTVLAIFTSCVVTAANPLWSRSPSR